MHIKIYIQIYCIYVNMAFIAKRAMHVAYIYRERETHTQREMYIYILHVYECIHSTVGHAYVKCTGKKSYVLSSELWYTLCVCVCVCKYTYIHTYIHTYVHTYIHTYIIRI
jgi:hypothetical protein